LEFEPQETRFVRVVIQETSGGQPGIDELEIFGPGGKRTWPWPNAAVASASSLLPGTRFTRSST
jgi:hypothetical protein